MINNQKYNEIGQSRWWWIWPVFIRRKIRQDIFRLAGAAKPFCTGCRGFLSAIVIGSLPFLLSFRLGLYGHQFISALLLAILMLYFIREDQTWKGVACLSVAYLSHCILVIVFTHYAPLQAESILPKSGDYWDKQFVWITTGQDPEYEIANWLPAHLIMLFGVVVYGYGSLGLFVFYEGFFQVDLMNFYNGQLMSISEQPHISLQFGWHLWSILRGIAYLFITFEIISLSLERMTCMQLSTRNKRLFRWNIGIVFFLADCLVKLLMMETVRDILFLNMIG